MLSGDKMRPTLRNFLARYRVTPYSTTGIAPCELLLRRHLRAELDLLQPTSIDVHKGTHVDAQKPAAFTEGQQV